jgi:hypothetical protein
VKAFIEIREIEIGQDSAYVRLRYDAHGVVLKSSFKLKNCDWSLVNSSLFEY